MPKAFRILVIDDDSLIREIIAFKLLGEGYVVEQAKNGKEGLVLANKFLFDLVISDLHMPVMNGLDFCMKLKSLDEYKLIPFIFLSTDKEKNHKIKGLAQGADDYMTKPFDPEILIAKVESCIKKHIIRKNQFQKNKSNHLNFNYGEILICANNTNHKLLQAVCSELPNTLVVKNDQELSYNIENNNIWLVILLEDAQWAFNSISRLKNLSKNKEVQICAVMDIDDEDELLRNVEEIGLEIIPNYQNPKLILNNIQSRLKREFNIKNKYIGALNRAAKHSPLRFDKEMSVKNDWMKLVVFHQPYEQIPGGDYYEVFDLDNDCYLIAIGDVMGKEWGAWFFVMGYIAYIRSSIRFLLNTNVEVPKNPSLFLSFLNEQVYKDIQLSEVFTTLTLVYINSNKEINLASAGGISPLIYKSQADEICVKKMHGRILGLETDSKYENISIELTEGDSLLLYTDGYSEAVNRFNKLVGTNGVAEAFEEYNNADKSSNKQFDEVFRRKNGIEEFNDDRTCLMILNHG